MLRIGLATIGQAPRNDVVPSMFPDVDPSMLLQAGALDDLDDSSIDALAPVDGHTPLVTRLRDGREVVVSEQLVTPLLEHAVVKLHSHGAQIVCVLCTGAFALDAPGVRLVYPDTLLTSVVNSLLPVGRLGVLMPHEGQTEWMTEKWAVAGRSVELGVLSPYEGGQIDAAVELFVASDVELIVMDCMGYTVEHQDAVRAATGVPVVLANRLVGSIISSIATQPVTR